MFDCVTRAGSPGTLPKRVARVLHGPHLLTTCSPSHVGARLEKRAGWGTSYSSRRRSELQNLLLHGQRSALAMQYSGRRFASLPRQRAPAGRPCSTFRAAPLCDVYQFPPRPRAGEQIYKNSRLFSISFLWADLKQESVTHYSKRASNRGGRVGGASSARPSPTKREGELAPTGRGRCGRRDSGRHEWQRGQRAGDGRRRDRRDN